MNTVFEILNVLWPLIVVSIIVIFVIYRLIHLSKTGKMYKMKTRQAQSMLDCSIPFGMLIGTAVGAIIHMFIPVSMGTTLSLGSGIGMFFGYLMYESFGRKGHTDS